eukprot:82723_1
MSKQQKKQKHTLASNSMDVLIYWMKKSQKPKYYIYIMDLMLGIYYENCGRNDYYDENGHGKLAIFLDNNGMDSDHLLNALNQQINRKNKLIKLG